MNNSFTVTPDLYASKGNRFANYIIDGILIRVIIFGAAFVVSSVYYYFADDTSVVDDFIYKEEPINPFLDILLTAFITVLLYFLLELLTKGRSVGKYVTKTKIVLEDGSQPKAVDYLKRSFSRIIPFEPFSFLGDEGRGWHDTISKTYVVDIEKFESKMKSHDELDQIGVAQIG